MKSGTTTLSDFLNNSDDFYAPQKEGHLFYDDVFDKMKIKKYENLCDRVKWFSDKTPTYGIFDESPNLIYDYNPNASIIWILRDPIKRALSHIVHAQKTGAESRDAEQCIRDELSGVVRHRSLAYLLRSDYCRQINKYKKFFSQEQILVLKYEDFIAAEEHVFNQLAQFLDIDVNPCWTIPYSNRSFYPRYYWINKYLRKVPKRRFVSQIVHKMLPKLSHPEVLTERTMADATNYLDDAIDFWNEL